MHAFGCDGYLYVVYLLILVVFMLYDHYNSLTIIIPLALYINLNIKSYKMYVHLNKKINVPNCNKVRTISWSSDHDFIACGGDNGVLKVIKLENKLNSPTFKVDTNKNFTHNQTLENHKSTIQHVCWNEKFQKLTSSDESGSIIVWMFYNGGWFEEMVNNRNKSLVTGMAWTLDGQKICIVYDG